MNKFSHKKRNVVIVVNLSRASRRDILSVIFDTVNELGDWNIHIIQNPAELTAETVRLWQTDGTNGAILIDEGLPEATAALLSSTVPLVVVGTHGHWLRKRRHQIAFVRIDDLAIGKFAACELLKLGRFNSVAFLPAQDIGTWCQLRERGFTSVISRTGLHVQVFNPVQHGNVAGFLKQLEKPAAVFSACDRIVLESLGTRPDRSCGLPDTVAILGVDDDKLICDTMRPRLSSIRPDHDGLGRTAARALSTLMHKRSKDRPIKVLCPKASLNPRETTHPVAPAARLVERARAYIQRNACRNIKVSDVATSLGVSRRLLDLRFSQFTNTSIAAEILSTKIEAVKQALIETNDSLSAIARRCGFSSRNHLQNVFRRHVGKTLTEFRNSKAREDAE